MEVEPPELSNYVNVDGIVSNDEPDSAVAIMWPEFDHIDFYYAPSIFLGPDQFGVDQDFFLSYFREDVLDSLWFCGRRYMPGNYECDLLDYRIPVRYEYRNSYVNPCGNDAPPLPAPVDLTKSFQPVPYPNGDVDRVQVKWFKGSPEVRFQPQDGVGCDIQFWPIRDLATNTPIIGADSVMISDVTKPDKELFKWPIKFRADGVNNSKRVEPSTRYNWRVRCACDYGSGPESEWSEIKIFNTPAFDPSTGIYIPPPGQYLSENGEVKSTGQEVLELKAFPNPVQDILTIQSVQSIALDRIEILDMTGRLVLQENAVMDKQLEYRLDMSPLPTGLYMARVWAGEMEQVLRFEKY
ncbi:MAG: T9SS type A sorting domain-containing protein [Flavobacteriales bacterium]|nr:T9SS type A sorting domain-containing protein [Flavobacteriales bacterium]